MYVPNALLISSNLYICRTTERLHFHALKKEMATHSSVLAWGIPGMGAWWAAVYGVAESDTTDVT